MTVLEASERLFEWFSENDYFVLSEDFARVNPISDSVEKDKAVFVLALADLVSNDLVSSGELENEICWILKKPFSSFEQSVALNPATALSIAHLINGFCEVVGDNLDYCDASNITEKDINNVIIISTHLLNDKTDSLLDTEI